MIKLMCRALKNVYSFYLVGILFLSLSMVAWIGGCGGGGSDGGGGDDGNQELNLRLGSWTGTDISFTINPGSYLIDDLSITYRGFASGTTCSYNYETTEDVTETITVENDSFLYETSGLTVYGVFNNTTSVEVEVSWYYYNAQCDATESGNEILYADYDGAYVRFINGLVCNGSSFNASLKVCGTSFNSTSGSWSSCKIVDPGTCSLSVSANVPECGAINITGSLDLNENCNYNFVLGLYNGNPSLGYIPYCPGDCDTPAPSAVGNSFKFLSNNFIENEGFTSVQ